MDTLTNFNAMNGWWELVCIYMHNNFDYINVNRNAGKNKYKKNNNSSVPLSALLDSSKQKVSIILE